MFKNILQSIFTKGLIAFLNLVILIVSSRYLGVSSRGEISLFILNIAIVQLINEIYTGYGLVHFIPKFEFKKIFFTGLLFTLSFTSISQLLITILHKHIIGYEWLSYFISLIVILHTFQCVLLLGKEKVAIYNLISFLQPFLLTVGLFVSIFVLKEFTLKAYVYPLLISFIVVYLLSFYAVSGFIFKPENSTTFRLKTILINGSISQLGLLMYFFCNRYSYYLLPDSAKVGLYASASSLTEAVLLLVNGISPVLLARVANQAGHQENVKLTLSLSKLSFIFSTCLLILLYTLPDRLFTFILGDGFRGIHGLMMLYAPGILMISISGVISNFLSASGQTKLVLICNGFGFLSVLICAPILIRKYGVEGAAYSANISYFIISICTIIMFVRMNKLILRKSKVTSFNLNDFLRTLH